jgi:hypothetical protein
MLLHLRARSNTKQPTASEAFCKLFFAVVMSTCGLLELAQLTLNPQKNLRS